MSDHEESRRNRVQRVGRKDRKNRIPAAKPLFPPEDLPPAPISPPEQSFAHPSSAPDFPDLDVLLPDEDQDALKMLANLTPDQVRPLIVTPDAERFPPVKPPRPRPQPEVGRQKTPQRQPRKGRLYNLLTVFFGLAAVIVVGYFVIIWQNPYSPLNFFPPPTPFIVVTATPGGPPIAAPGNDTPEETAAPSLSGMPFTLASEVLYIANANGRGCEWSSIAGTITGIDGLPRNGLGVQLSSGERSEKVFSGTAQTFGPGGFELFLSGAPQEAEFTLQLLSAAGVPLSDPVIVQTRATCGENVAIVHFIQVSDF